MGVIWIINVNYWVVFVEQGLQCWFALGGVQEGLLRALESFEQADLPWIERLDVTSAAPLRVANPDDDLDRELQLCVAARLTFHPLPPDP